MASKRRLRRAAERRPAPAPVDPYAKDIAAELCLIAQEGAGRDCCDDQYEERDEFLRAFPQYT